MKYELVSILILPIFIMTTAMVSFIPAHSLTNNDTIVNTEIPNNQNLTIIQERSDRIFDASTSCKGNINDIDGDMIPTNWEQKGIDINNDNIIDYALNETGASPFHKDLFLEVDYMKFHKPIGNAINDTISSFANSPVCNPDGISGINLHVELDEEIPEQKNLDMVNGTKGLSLDEALHFRDYYTIKSSHFGNLDEQLDPNKKNILDAKKKIYHYGLFIHTVNEKRGLLGIAKDIPAWDFVVSLGASRSPNSNGHLIGTESQQASTFMHEFGHTIGLYHGGSDAAINNKPNYIGIMNYLMTNAIVANSKLDYSRCGLDSLNEFSLDEQKGITGITNSCPDGVNTAFYESCIYSPASDRWIGIPQQIITGKSVDWDLPKDIDNKIKEKNVNCDGMTMGSHDRVGEIYIENMKGYEDWSNIKYLPTNVINENPLGDSNGETSVQSNNVTQIDNNQTNNNNTDNDNIKLKTLLEDEPTQDDITFQILAVLAELNSHVDNNINESSFQIPTEDLEGNSRSAHMLADEVDAPISAKEYYNMVLGDPLLLINTTDPESQFADEMSEDTVANNIFQGDIDAAIQKLDNLLTTSDSSFDGNPNDDYVSNPVDQQKLIEKISNLKNILEKNY